MEGLSDDDIIKALKPSYSNKDLNDAMNQSKQDIPEDNVLEEINKIHSGPDLPSLETEEESEELLEEAPLPEDSGEEIQTQQQEYPSYGVQSSMSNDQMQQVIEAVVEEKWEDLISKVGDLNLWKESVNNDLEAVKLVMKSIGLDQQAPTQQATSITVSLPEYKPEPKTIEIIEKE